MTAGPSSPGVGPPVYQPAGKPLGGTCSDPSARSPRSINLESTPIAAICRRTGTDLSISATLTRVIGATLRGAAMGGSEMGGSEMGGTTATPAGPEQPAAPMVIVANRAATITTLERTRSG